MTKHGFLGVLVLTFAMPVPAASQFVEVERNLWGVSASIIPGFEWQAPQAFKAFYLADEIDLRGTEFQVGVVRGSMSGGDSGWSFIRQPVKEGSFVRDGEDPAAVRLTAAGDVTLDGIMYHRYAPFTTIRDRVQIGMIVSGGAGWYRGTVDRSRTVDGVPTDDRVAASLLSGLGRESESGWIPMPMFRFEGAVAGILGAGFKARVSGGYALPNGRVIRIGIVYLVGS